MSILGKRVFLRPVGNEGAGSEAGSNDQGTSNNQDDKTKAENDKVDYNSFEKLLNQKKELQRKLKEFEESKAEQERKSKLEQERFKELFEEEQKAKEKLEKNLFALTQERIFEIKERAFKDALPCKLLHANYIAHADLDNIVINEENGEIDLATVKKVVDSFVKGHSHLLQAKNDKNLPNDAGGASQGKKIPYEVWLKLPLKEKKERMKDVID